MRADRNRAVGYRNRGRETSRQFKREDQEGAGLPGASQQTFTGLGEVRRDTRVDVKHSNGDTEKEIESKIKGWTRERPIA